LNGAPGERAELPGVAKVVVTPPVVVVPQFTPAVVPGCRLLDPIWGFSAKTAPADGSSRQAPTVREANTCFISALPFKIMLRIGQFFGELRRAYWPTL